MIKSAAEVEGPLNYHFQEIPVGFGARFPTWRTQLMSPV